MSRYDVYGKDAQWRGIIKSRDDYACQVCGKRQSPRSLHAHHLYSYSDHPNLRTDPTNGITLCENCHDLFHSHYGKGNNTPQQYYQFKENYKNGMYGKAIKKTVLSKPVYKIKKLKRMKIT